MEYLLITLGVVFVYYIAVEGLNFVGAAKETGKIVAKGTAEVPNATKWIRNEIVLGSLEYDIQKQSMGPEYKRTFKETYKSQRKESNERFKPTFTEQEGRKKSLQNELLNINK